MFSFTNTSNPWDTSASYRVGTNNESSEMGIMSSTHSDSSNNSESSDVHNESNIFNISRNDISSSLQLQLSLQETRDKLANINNLIATAERNLNDIGLGGSSGDSSTPRVVSRQVIPNRADFSFDVAPSVVIGRFPISNSVIDLCTPEAPRRVEGFINLVDSYEPPVRVNRRGARPPIVQVDDAESIDLTESPPKRSCNTARDNANTSVSEDLYKCPVCFESVRQREPCTTRCGHVFCKECIQGAVRSTQKCPLCRKKIGIRQLTRVYL
ncbi:uncharacterized protein LOC133837887 [Drosophila sulfurigaster albostrigata]|uniref:uncharacterized protein LOC133837887 n=1 Tax=Drosophila sulfurigaster albostrigata TaxID=89887 RepID=UPI002D21B0D8|nr:uncharacterized protein LOC133837887 [Drosophila sulfurigaster albostrigata]